MGVNLVTGDCISRQAVLEMAYDLSEIDGEHFTEPHMVVDVEDIQKLSSVEPEKGKWIKYGVPRCNEQHYQCTNCKYYINLGMWGEVYTKQFRYCPNCRAEMEEEE